MRRSFGRLFLLIAAFSMGLTPVAASADTLSVSQTITVTAVVAPARSIVVNNQGQMIKIYSNTSQNVAPKVYLGDVPGAAQLLTPALLQQYNQIMRQQKNLVGVAIPVPAPLSTNTSISDILMKTVSSLTRPLSL